MLPRKIIHQLQHQIFPNTGTPPEQGNCALRCAPFELEVVQVRIPTGHAVGNKRNRPPHRNHLQQGFHGRCPEVQHLANPSRGAIVQCLTAQAVPFFK